MMSWRRTYRKDLKSVTKPVPSCRAATMNMLDTSVHLRPQRSAASPKRTAPCRIRWRSTPSESRPDQWLNLNEKHSHERSEQKSQGNRRRDIVRLLVELLGSGKRCGGGVQTQCAPGVLNFSLTWTASLDNVRLVAKKSNASRVQHMNPEIYIAQATGVIMLKWRASKRSKQMSAASGDLKSFNCLVSSPKDRDRIVDRLFLLRDVVSSPLGQKL